MCKLFIFMLCVSFCVNKESNFLDRNSAFIYTRVNEARNLIQISNETPVLLGIEVLAMRDSLNKLKELRIIPVTEDASRALSDVITDFDRIIVRATEQRERYICRILKVNPSNLLDELPSKDSTSYQALLCMIQVQDQEAGILARRSAR